MKSTKLTGHKLRFRIDAACAVMFALFGYDAGVLGGVMETPQFLASIFGASMTPSGPYDLPLIASSYTLAAFAATPFVMVYGMRTGRRLLLLWACALVFVGAIIQAASYGMAQIIVARVICGFGIGLISATVPAYQTEQSIDQRNRGRKTAITCSILIFGIPFAYWFDYGMSFINSSVSWRIPIALQGLPAALAGLIFYGCPDTPRWYYATGQIEKGDDTITSLFGASLDNEVVLNEKMGILAAIELEHHAIKPKLSDYLWDRSELKVAKRMVICFLILSFQQLMSINFLVYYATFIFRQNGASPNMAAILGATANTVYATGTLPTIWLIDRVGRRGMMFYTACICTVIMTSFVILLGLPEGKQSEATRTAVSALIIIYSWFFGAGWISPCWQYAPEISPLELRHVGGALNASGEWFWSFVTVFASPIAQADPNVGWKVWLWYLVFNILAIPFTYYLPETGEFDVLSFGANTEWACTTAGKNLEELDTLFCAANKKDGLMLERARLMKEAHRTVAKREDRQVADVKAEQSFSEVV